MRQLTPADPRDREVQALSTSDEEERSQASGTMQSRSWGPSREQEVLGPYLYISEHLLCPLSSPSSH